MRSLVPSEPVVRDPGRDLDPEAIRVVDPALVIVDTWNETWSEDPGAHLEALLGHPVEVWAWEVRTFRDTLEQGLRLGRRFGAMDHVMRIMGDREAELRLWRERTGIHRRAHDAVLEPVTVVSSLDPPAAAAGWAHDVVDRAAARLCGGRSGQAAIATDWESMAIEPNCLAIVSLPGLSVGRMRERLDIDNRAQEALTRAERVIFYDGRGTLHSAGPGLHDAILDLMAVVHDLDGRDLSGRVCNRDGTAVSG